MLFVFARDGNLSFDLLVCVWAEYPNYALAGVVYEEKTDSGCSIALEYTKSCETRVRCKNPGVCPF
ncbi:MAG TPA: hypothetical protein VM432_06495 [Bdellovibrionales bacterium]|nr:hypothetical protein [Bdellovibrionales bacterium]